MFEQDDMENWVEVTQALRGPIARGLWLQYKLGLDCAPSNDRLTLEVSNLQLSSHVEDSERVFYGHWQKLMMQRRKDSNGRKPEKR